MNRLIQDGFSLVFRHQRAVWWIFFVNLLLGFLASITPRTMLQPVLNKSLYSQNFSQHFDLGVFLEFLAKPDRIHPHDSASTGSHRASFVRRFPKLRGCVAQFLTGDLGKIER